MFIFVVLLYSKVCLLLPILKISDQCGLLPSLYLVDFENM